MRVAAYLRVSTDTQAEHGLGLDVQRQAIRAWARQHGHKIASWHSDEGISGSNGLDTRDALPDAVEEIRENRTAGIVVYRLDRLARDLILQETLLAEIASLGGRVFSTMPGEQDVIEDDPDDPSRRHDLRRDGIAVHYAEARMAAAARHAVRLLEVLGVAAAVPDEPGPHDRPSVAQPGGGWISGPSSPA